MVAVAFFTIRSDVSLSAFGPKLKLISWGAYLLFGNCAKLSTTAFTPTVMLFGVTFGVWVCEGVGAAVGEVLPEAELEETCLVQINFLPLFIHVRVVFPTTVLIPSFLHLAPALAAA